MSGVAGALLAAGSSSRFGRPKALLSWKGTTLLRRAAAELAAVTSPVVVVLPPDADPYAAEVDGLGVRIAINRSPERGVGRSIAAAARALAYFAPEATGLVVLHVDQPLVGRDLLLRLIAAAGAPPERPAACADAGGTIGPPTLFPASFFPELLALDGDRGGRALLERHRASLAVVEAPEAFVDLDVPADYERLIDSPPRSAP
jgi:molybdenum cofactor cytidylyltransferase